MNQSAVYLVFIGAAFIAANIPWLSDRFLVIIRLSNKNGWLRWLEWLFIYGLIGLLSVGLEYKLTGVRQDQDWEFYVTTFCLFVVFALPGFIYHYDLKEVMRKR